jgi:hypothetical protein
MAITAQTKVLTLDWWKPASKLEVGDYVFDQNGKPVQITMAQQYRAEDCYEVQFDDYLSVTGDQHLEFLVETPKYRKRLWEYVGRFKFRRPLHPKPVKELLEGSLRDKRNRSMYSVPSTKPLQTPHQDLPVPPYVFGFWFFNRKSQQKLAAPAGLHDEVAVKLKDYGYIPKPGPKRSDGRQEFTLFPTVEAHLAPNIPNRVPNNYLLASVEQRIELLRGILVAKSRQYNPENDTFRIASRNLPTLLRIQMLVESLGSRTRIKDDETLHLYTLFFKSHIPLVSNQVSTPVKVHHARRYAMKITPAPAQLCVHIETSGDDNTILVGEGFIPCR